MNQKQLLDAILEKTAHVRGGIAANDIDIVMNALDEREGLIDSYSKGNYGTLTGDCARIASQIAGMDAENTRGLKALMDECNEGLFEARRKIKELQAGKKATHQYHGAATANMGAVFDFKR